MLRYRLFQMLTYCRVRSALKKTLALPNSKISNFEDDSTFLRLLSFVALYLLGSPVLAQDDYSQVFDEYRVHYSVFSSTSISAEMAERYGLVRGKDRVFVNIAVVPKDEQFGGIKAEVNGAATNLMQQQKELAFREIEEPNAVYYLAPLRHTNREVFNFLINVDPDGPPGPYEIKFTKKLFTNP